MTPTRVVPGLFVSSQASIQNSRPKRSLSLKNQTTGSSFVAKWNQWPELRKRALPWKFFFFRSKLHENACSIISYLSNKNASHFILAIPNMFVVCIVLCQLELPANDWIRQDAKFFQAWGLPVLVCVSPNVCVQLTNNWDSLLFVFEHMLKVKQLLGLWNQTIPDVSVRRYLSNPRYNNQQLISAKSQKGKNILIEFFSLPVWF